VVLIPATVAISYLFGDRKYYIASVVIMILAMVPFFVYFEQSRPGARYLATLAVMTAIAVISRVAFIWLPNFKPMAGIIVITAMAFGPQAGFMCGSLSIIVSNIIFGQGPWTPWQMFCYGLIGFIAGALAKSKLMSERHSIRTAIITFFLVLVLSSLILDTSSLFLVATEINTASVISIYLLGIPMNILNGLSSGICVFLLLKPLMAMFNRLRTKYGF